MSELCDICSLPMPMTLAEEGGTRCSYCWEVTSRLKTFLGAPAARKLVAATLSEIGCAPRPCPACGPAVRLAEAAHVRDDVRRRINRAFAGTIDEEEEIGNPEINAAIRELEAALRAYAARGLHSPYCPNTVVTNG